MYVSYDLSAGATYVEVMEGETARTVEISDLVMVDVNASGEPLGVEFVVPPSQITSEMIDRVVKRFPTLDTLYKTEMWLLTH
jgi:uncharacterized protein YuzE